MPLLQTADLTLDAMFPAIRTGQRYEIAAGSRVGKVRLRGLAAVTTRSAREATIAVECRTFGLRSRGMIDAELHDDGSVSIGVRGLPFITVGVRGLPETPEGDHLTLAIEPSATIDVECDEAAAVRITGRGLRVGPIDLELLPID